MRKPKQAEFGFTNWGGARRGAGRKPVTGVQRVSHATRVAHSRREPVHVTLHLRAALPSLRTRRTHAIVLAALEDSVRVDFRVVHYAVLSNHAHLVCEGDDEVAVARGVQGLSVRIARRLNRLWGRRGPVFDDLYHAHVLRSPLEVRRALRYVLLNATKHGAGAGVDAFSSGTWFDGWRSSSRAESGEGMLPPARTWLLSTGWKLHGLIDASERCPRSPRSPGDSRAAGAPRAASL